MSAVRDWRVLEGEHLHGLRELELGGGSATAMACIGLSPHLPRLEELTLRPDRFHRMERSHGPFLRSFQLSEEVDPARVSAQLRDGVLRLELPKVTGRAGSRRERE